MHELNEFPVLSFNEISTEYPDNYIVVEVLRIDHTLGIEEGKALFLCDSYEAAWDKASSLKNTSTIVLEGIHRMNTVGVVL